LLVLKEAFQPVYEELIQSALKNRDQTISEFIGGNGARQEWQRVQPCSFLVYN